MSSAEGLSAAQKTQQQDTIDLMRANEYGPVARAIVKHLDGRGRRNLLAANRACRQWVLSTAPAARLQLSLATDCDETAWKARLGVLRECLRERRARPVCLALTGLGTYASIDRLGPIPYNLLHNAGGSITQLVVSSTDHRQPPTAANIRYFLKSAATALPSLTSLDLQGVTFPLPPPPSLPSLTHITLSIPCDAVAPIIDSACQELAKYLPHIHTLAIWQPQREQFLAASPTWPQLFSTGATSDSLVSFATDQCLSDQLLGLLITHAPALRSLTVGRLGVWEGGCREREWGVGELRVCRGDRPAAQEITVCAERLANLPRSREGCLEVRGATRLELRLNEVLDFPVARLADTVTERLSHWRFHDIKTIDTYGLSDEASLTPLLSHLTALHTRGAALSLGRIQHDTDTFAVLAAALPTLQDLRFAIDLAPTAQAAPRRFSK